MLDPNARGEERGYDTFRRSVSGLFPKEVEVEERSKDKDEID